MKHSSSGDGSSCKSLLGILSIVVAANQFAPAYAAEMIVNPREIHVGPMIRGQAPTQVIADDVNVRTQPTTYVTPGAFPFARLDKGDEVYVLSCEGISDDHFWTQVWIPEIGEIGYVVAEYLQNNYQTVCDRTRPY